MIPVDFNSVDYYHLNKEQIENELDYSFGDLDKTMRQHYSAHGQIRNLPYKLEIPADFKLQEVLDINPELQEEFKPLGQNIELNKEVFLKCKKFNFLHKLILPQDFDKEGYKKYNPDLNNMSDNALIKHYVLNGKNEGRVYKLDLPADFCVNTYKRYNPDLANIPDIYAERHYCAAGVNEGRIYKVTLPDDFESEMYSYMNPDLEGLPEAELEKHYFEHGQKEKREYKDPLYDAEYFSERYGIYDDSCGYSKYMEDIRKVKSKAVEDILNVLPSDEIDLLLISHQTSFFGATHYLYALFCYIREHHRDKKIKIAEQYHDSVLTAKYGLSENDIAVYHNDPTILWHITEKLKPKKILVNSANRIINPVLQYLDRSKTILHSHEVREHYQAVIKNITPDFVVSKKIADQWEGRTIPIQPPFIDTATRELLDIAQPAESVANEYGNIDLTKLVVGMCGDLSSRKNPELFASLAVEFQDINFIWIGGHDDFPVQGLKNLYHIKSVANPYGYFKLFDYFLLTSIIDPCPYVVLENLYLNNRVIAFEKNIFTAHNIEQLQDAYIEIPDKINYTEAAAVLHNLKNKGKVTYKKENGKNYVLKNFSALAAEYLNTLLNT